LLDTTVSHYRIRELLGEGGMGVVYRAEDLRLGRDVALKFLREQVSHRPLAVERFRREARAASGLNHPHICTIYDVDEDEGRHFIAMELLQGFPLQQRIAGGPLDPALVLELATQIVDGLEAAHSKGIVHRDLKPSNLFVTERDRVKILDFGLVKLLEAHAAAVSPDATTATSRDLETAAGLVMGTPPYMSPEQVRGEDVDARTDVFSFGAVLYEMATGQPAFAGRTSGLIYDAVLNRTPTPPAELRPDLPAELDRIIEKALEKQPRLRYQSASEIQADLMRLRRDREQGRVQRAPGRAQAIDSIAVLPLANLSGDPAQDHFADGMTDALISDLARVRALRVISRTSVMRYRGSRRSLPEIARELNVQVVVEGSVLRAGDRVRISAQLIDAARDLHLWAESYERDIRDVLKLQAEVARAITREIQVVLTPREQAVLGKAVTVNPEAHQDYLLGRFHWNKRTPDALRRGLEFFQRALTKDAGYAPAYSGIADTHLILSVATYDLVSPREALPQARAAALRALEIDDTLAEARISLANVRARFEWDWAGADAEYVRALELDPNYAYGYHCFASHEAAMGRFAEALAHQERAMELDPFSIVVSSGRARLFYFARQYERARAQCRSALEMEPQFWVAHLLTGLCLLREGAPDKAVESLERACSLGEGLTMPLAARAAAYAESGQRDRAKRELEQLLAMSQNRYVPAYLIAAVHSSLGDHDPAFEWLERAFHERSETLTWLGVAPFWDLLRQDPRLAALQARVGLPA
jgi:TolB-like protein/Tfp pilus assembly protein PilF/predicted Ser/Thr protein kinase